MKVLVVDDEPLARNELIYLLHKYDEHLSIQEADDIPSALTLLLQEHYDVAFLDIQLRDASGMTLAESINKMPDPPLIIFATAYDQYAITAFENNARDYLLKPYEPERLKAAMDKVRQSLRARDNTGGEQAQPLAYPISEEDRIYMVQASDIIMIEALQGKTIIHTSQKQYESHDSLAYWQEKLPSEQFVRVHRSYLVNLQMITVVEPWFNQTLRLTLADHLKVPVSRANVKSLKERLGITS
ncbi:LytR/AlgR family response regulator transcription factor [Streptococcus caviae]|uniref:LytR/AlgR family response regulator transcription factor n=1 Tax=Streptococcus sp. 'caviae' TaxID=1915004 RepID=UPI00094BB761|nr:LytTR family transcriptional regulator DNA-binding domain-containing protein [Streptococcus sp. 'caviae']OLN84150.1 DNA-binding response regulator [Streptococcus sp. 'caviae']